MLSPLRVASGLLALVAMTLLATGCSGNDAAPVASLTPDAAASGTLGPGFWNPTDPPTPEATITPSPGSWDHVRPKPGYGIALIVDGASADLAQQIGVLHDGVTRWAADVDAVITEFTATTADDYVTQVQAAIDAKPDLVISIGDGLVDAMALVTATNLETEFLLVGAEIAEPTANVTAADWLGAGYRGEGLGMASEYDPATFTPDRVDRAIRAGVAAVLNNLTGIVLYVS